MAPVLRTASRIAWPVKRQTAFGTPLAGTDLNCFLRLRDPLVINENAEHWTDRGMIGNGHDWESCRGRLKQSVQFEIPAQPLPVDFAGWLLALFFSGETASAAPGGAHEHRAGFPALSARPESYVTTLALREDNVDWQLQDVACRGLTLKGDSTNRLEIGGSLVASRVGGPLAGYTWPTPADSRFVYNYAGSFTLGGTDRRRQLAGFSLSLDSGINLDLAWRKAATEQERIYPALWPYGSERKMELGLSLVAESGDLAAFRAAQQGGATSALVLSCLGEAIPGTVPADHDGIEISVPRAMFTGLDYNYDKGLLHLDLKIEGRYDSATGGPLTVKTTEGSVTEYMITT
jgi:hypothetical protein